MIGNGKNGSGPNAGESRIVGAEGFPAQISGFGELAVGEEYGDIVCRFGTNRSPYTTKGRVKNSAFVTQQQDGHARLDSSGGNGDQFMESAAKHLYRVGHAAVTKWTMGAENQVGITRGGPYDVEEGFFIEVDNTTGKLIRYVIRNNGNTEVEVLADANGSFLENGGESLAGIDFRSLTIFYHKYGWLGVYPPTLWTIKNGRLYKVLTVTTEQGRVKPHIRHPSVPIRTEALNGAIVNCGSWFGGSIGGSPENLSYVPVSYEFARVAGNAALGEITMAHFRMKETDANGDIVRRLAALDSFANIAIPAAAGDEGLLRVRIWGGVTDPNTAYSNVRSDSLVEVNTTSTRSGGIPLVTEYLYFRENQGGTQATAGSDLLAASRQGLIGWAGDVFAVTCDITENIAGGADFILRSVSNWFEV